MKTNELIICKSGAEKRHYPKIIKKLPKSDHPLPKKATKKRPTTTKKATTTQKKQPKNDQEIRIDKQMV